MSAVPQTPPVAQPAAVRPKGRPTIVDPKSFVFWVLVGVLVFGATHTYSILTASGTIWQSEPAVAWSGLLLWTLYGILFLAVVYYHQLFVRRSPWITLAALAWGGLVATYFATEANAALNDLWALWVGDDFQREWGFAISAGVNEESLKTLGIVVLVLLPLAGVRSTLDGWFYGMMIGLGFQVVEDYLYTNQNAGDLGTVLNYVWFRGLVNGLWSHAIISGIVGGGIGYLVSRRDRPWWRRIAAAVVAFAFAIGWHITFDSEWLENLVGNGFVGFLVKSVPVLVLLLILVHVARDEERKVWTTFVSEQIDRDLVSEAEAEALLSHKSRKAARKAVASEKGRRAGRYQKHLQYAQLRYVQSVDEEGAGSKNATEDAAQIRELRGLIAAA